MAVYRQLALCQRLRRMRIETERTQKQVADFMGISQAAYSRLEKGEIEVTIQKLWMLSEFYKVGVDTMLRDI